MHTDFESLVGRHSNTLFYIPFHFFFNILFLFSPLLFFNSFSFPLSSIPVPTIAPGNVQVEAVNSTAIRFTWTAPNPQFINGINQGYKVSGPPTVSSQQAITSIDRAVSAEHVLLHVGVGGKKPEGKQYSAPKRTMRCFCQQKLVLFIFSSDLLLIF